jgi:hypothetical protein
MGAWRLARLKQRNLKLTACPQPRNCPVCGPQDTAFAEIGGRGRDRSAKGNTRGHMGSERTGMPLTRYLREDDPAGADSNACRNAFRESG